MLSNDGLRCAEDAYTPAPSGLKYLRVQRCGRRAADECSDEVAGRQLAHGQARRAARAGDVGREHHVGHREQIAKIGGQPLNLQAGAYYNVQHPDDGARWQIRFLVAFLFPK